MGRSKTTHIRVYKEDYLEIKKVFPKTSMPEFFRIAMKSNPLLQVEAALRKGKRKK